MRFLQYQYKHYATLSLDKLWTTPTAISDIKTNPQEVFPQVKPTGNITSDQTTHPQTTRPQAICPSPIITGTKGNANILFKSSNIYPVVNSRVGTSQQSIPTAPCTPVEQQRLGGNFTNTLNQVKAIESGDKIGESTLPPLGGKLDTALNHGNIPNIPTGTTPEDFLKLQLNQQSTTLKL